MDSEKPYNPLDKANLAESIVDAVLEREPRNLPPDENFVGAGIYLIYYLGDFAPYEPIAKRNKKDKYGCPIYIGKAVPPGSRRGGMDFDAVTGNDLYKRLVEHGESITDAGNLDIADFRCRYLILDDVWIPLGESLLIQNYQPVWNRIGGFGNHDPGGGRRAQQRSPWDVLHPGRAWAALQADNRKSLEEITAEVARLCGEME